MERIDKIIANQTVYSRKDVKKLVSAKKIKVNNNIINKSDIKIDIEKDNIYINDKKLEIKKYIYLVLNKPKGYVSATKDKNIQTVLDLIPKEYKKRNLFPVGRLDKDTTGLMIITDDGEFCHNVLSPKKHVSKIYKVLIDKEITNEMIFEFEKGVKLKEEICKSAKLEKITNNSCYVTLTEGKYHQIKRMFGCFNSKVLELERIQFGKFKLPLDLKQGEFRELNQNEIELLKK